ncbi:MAG TPA: LysR substrate-binding domain-containing protein, partial [Burkholderiales bacterium]|nr:LysR substrate-binding domain-containing protein [Burkholderiales bacterium]
TGTTGALITRVLNYEVEAAFVAEPFTANNLDSQIAFREKLVLITPKGFPKVRTPKDIGRQTIIAFETGCSYRRILRDWLGRAKVVPERVLEFGSYHALVACVASGAGIAIVPESVIRSVRVEKDVALHPLPAGVANVRTLLVWRRGHQSLALEALRQELRDMKE